MKHSKDLNWLSAPAFLLIVAMLAFNSKKPNTRNTVPEKIKTGTSTQVPQKQS